MSRAPVHVQIEAVSSPPPVHPLRSIGRLVPRPELAADYAVLATLMHHPDLIAPHVMRLEPSDFSSHVHRIIARMALWHVKTLGRADEQQLALLMLVAATMHPAALDIELQTLRRVSELVTEEGVVADAVRALVSPREDDHASRGEVSA